MPLKTKRLFKNSIPSFKAEKSKGEVLLLVLLFCLVFLTTVILSKMMLTNQIFAEREKTADFEQAYWIAEAGISAGKKSFLSSGSVSGTSSFTTTETSTTTESSSTTQSSSSTGGPSTLSGTVSVLSWQGGPSVVLGTYVVKKTGEDANTITLESTGTTSKKLSTRVLTVKINKQTFKIVSFMDHYSP